MNIDFTFLKEFKEVILIFLGLFLGAFFTIIGTFYSKHIEEKRDQKMLSKSIQWEIETNQLRFADLDILRWGLGGGDLELKLAGWKFERTIFTSYTNIIGILPMEIGAKILQYYSELTRLQHVAAYTYPRSKKLMDFSYETKPSTKFIQNWKKMANEIYELGEELIKDLEHIHGEKDK